MKPLPDPSPKPLLASAETLAARYGVSPKTIRKWGREGFLPFVKLSRRCVRYPVAECDEIVGLRKVKSISEISSENS